MAINSEFPHRVITELFSRTEDMTARTKWCTETFGSTNNGLWYETLVTCTLRSQNAVMPEYEDTPIKTQCFFFKNEEDAVAFKIRWDGYYNYSRDSKWEFRETR